MSEFELYHCPGTCSRVLMFALEHIGHEYVDTPINIFVGEQKKPDYMAINPKGKVPALRVGNELLTEVPAILIYLDETWPEANLLPNRQGAIALTQARASLVWCASYLHPLVRGLFKPTAYSEQEPESVRTTMRLQFEAQAKKIEAHLETHTWWIGDNWFIADVYLSWVMSIAAVAGMKFHEYPHIVQHARRISELPTFEKCYAREMDALKRSEIVLPENGELIRNVG